MKAHKTYFSCDSPDLRHLLEDAKLIALQKGCDPVRVPWPHWPPFENEESGNGYQSEINVCRNQFRREIPDCDLFVAIVDDKYGHLKVQSSASPDEVSPMHFELLEIGQLTGRQPEVMIFSLSVEQEPEVQRMLSVAPTKVIKFDADQEFRITFSKKLTEFRQRELRRSLAGLRRMKVTVTCKDETGLLERISKAVSEGLKGNLAYANQVTRGREASILFVAEWPETLLPEASDLETPLRASLPGDDIEIHSEEIKEVDPEIQSLLITTVTFLDQPGAANNVFSTFSSGKLKLSIVGTQVETFLSGGLLLGRSEVSVNGDAIARDQIPLLVEELRRLPGILQVESTVRRGRYWS